MKPDVGDPCPACGSMNWFYQDAIAVNDGPTVVWQCDDCNMVGPVELDRNHPHPPIVNTRQPST